MVRGLSLAVFATSLVPSLVSAQAGAIGAAIGIAGGVENAHVGVPIQTEHAVTLPKGFWSAGAHAGVTMGGIGQVDFSVFQTLLGAYYGISDNLTVGASVFPVSSLSLSGTGVDESGSAFGDLSLYSKLRLGGTGDGRTSFAAIGALQLPTSGSITVGTQSVKPGAEGVIAFGGLAVSHRNNNTSFHASSVLALPTDDLDGDPYVALGGAAVFGVSDRVGVSGELLASLGDNTQLSAGPGVRFRASDQVFLDGAALFLIGSNRDFDPYDWGFSFGVNIGG